MLNRTVRTHRSTRRHTQAGISLIESLTALLVLALGVGGLAWAQARHLAEGRESSARANAVLLSHDLGNRMLFNRAATARGDYRLSWGELPQAKDCLNRRCSGEQLAQADLAAWRAAVAQALPGGDANVFALGSAPRRIGIAIAWPVTATGSEAQQLPFAISAQQHGIDCPASYRCHVVHASF